MRGGLIITTHELARQLLAMEDIPVIHHFHHQDGFEDNPFDYYSVPLLEAVDGVVTITTGRVLDIVEDTSWEEV